MAFSSHLGADLMNVVSLGLLTVLIGSLLWLLIATDRRSARLSHLSVDGRTVEGSSIVLAQKWLNARTGLLNHSGLPEGSGLLLRGARIVHTRGMLFAIDLVYLDDAGYILSVDSSVQPGRRRAGPHGTRSVLELAAGDARRFFGLRAGECLKFPPADAGDNRGQSPLRRI